MTEAVQEIDDEMSKRYQAVFASEQGKQVLSDILTYGMIDASTMFVGDPHRTSFNEGKRAVALHLLRMMVLDLDIDFTREMRRRHLDQQKNLPTFARR